MDAVGADQHVAAHGLAAQSRFGVAEMRDDAALVLQESLQPQPRADRAGAEFGDHRVVDQLLQPAAMDRELRIVEAGVGAAQFAPHLLPEPADIVQLLGADPRRVERRQQAERGKLLDRVRQDVDADADLADLRRLLADDGLDAAPMQHQRERQPADPGPGDDRLHGAASGGGRKSTSCLAASATTSAGVCSVMLWIAQNRS